MDRSFGPPIEVVELFGLPPETEKPSSATPPEAVFAPPAHG
jgi:hypothetical protein